jgi:hypothetical protein
MNKLIVIMATVFMIGCGYVKGQTTIGPLTKEYRLKSNSFNGNGTLIQNTNAGWENRTFNNILKSPDYLQLTFRPESSFELVESVNPTTSIRMFEKLLHIPTTYFATDFDVEQALKLKSKSGALKGTL